jgi:hypothetical protein
MENIGVAHMGDIGHTLTEEQIGVLGNIDVLMVPIGGNSTVDAAGAWRIVEQPAPKDFFLPMHYKTACIDAKLDGLEPFAAMFSYVRERANPRTHYTLFHDADRCVGRYSCEVHCMLEKEVPVGPRLMRIVQIRPKVSAGTDHGLGPDRHRGFRDPARRGVEVTMVELMDRVLPVMTTRTVRIS